MGRTLDRLIDIADMQRDEEALWGKEERLGLEQVVCPGCGAYMILTIDTDGERWFLHEVWREPGCCMQEVNVRSSMLVCWFTIGPVAS